MLAGVRGGADTNYLPFFKCRADLSTEFCWGEGEHQMLGVRAISTCYFDVYVASWGLF